MNIKYIVFFFFLYGKRYLHVISCHANQVELFVIGSLTAVASLHFSSQYKQMYTSVLMSPLWRNLEDKMSLSLHVWIYVWVFHFARRTNGSDRAYRITVCYSIMRRRHQPCSELTFKLSVSLFHCSPRPLSALLLPSACVSLFSRSPGNESVKKKKNSYVLQTEKFHPLYSPPPGDYEQGWVCSLQIKLRLD